MQEMLYINTYVKLKYISSEKMQSVLAQMLQPSDPSKVANWDS